MALYFNFLIIFSVGQTIIVPFDIISQHLMLMGQVSNTKTANELKASVNPFNIELEGRSKAAIAADITKNVYRRDGLKGFYRGYTAAVCTYGTSSAFWWTFYHFFQEIYDTVIPSIGKYLLI